MIFVGKFWLNVEMVEFRNGRASYGGIAEACEISVRGRGNKAGRWGFVSEDRQLLSTHVHSEKLLLLDDGIVNRPRGRQKKTQAAEIGDQRNRDSHAHRSKWKVLS